MEIAKKILRFILPNWLADDICNYFTHPYWTQNKKQLVNKGATNLVQSAGITNKSEKTSSRRPFKRVNQAKVLSYFHKENVNKILEVGCGVGNLVSLLAEQGFDVYGITINPLEIEQAKHKNIFLHDIQSDLTNSKLAGIQFDAILSFDCIEHLDSPLVALKNINKLLKNNGLFISYLPPVRWTECDYHIVVYSPRQFRWLLNLAGFDLIEKEGGYRMSKKGVVYFARKIKADGAVYPGIME